MSEYYRSPALENYVSFSQRASLFKTEALRVLLNNQSRVLDAPESPFE